MTACILLAWLKLLALDGGLAKAELNTLWYRLLHVARIVCGARRVLKIAANWPWSESSPPPGSASRRSLIPSLQEKPAPSTSK
jgi:hypothetical protein